MMPTLLTGDFILVNKYTYGLRLPVVDKKILEMGAPQRGDVVVFRFPENPKVDYIKRVVGVPGDTVGYINKVVYLNGERVEQRHLGFYEGVGSGKVMTGAEVREERLDETQHRILVSPRRFQFDAEYVIPPGQYFVMGDNRDNSNDSRFWGPVPETNLVGKAMVVWLNWDWSGGVFDFTRIGNSIH
jgi:signal peptidase I